jgi:predicted transcriptional regulator
MADQENRSELLELTSEIVAAHVSNNTLAVNDLPQLIKDVYFTLANVDEKQEFPERLNPPVSIKKSVTPDFIVCLEDGKKLKMLKRHHGIIERQAPSLSILFWCHIIGCL